MSKQDIVPGDWFRIMFGEAPVIFLLEVLIRTLLIYIALQVTVRMMGKRMGGQLTISELAVMITLGAIVSPGMQMPQTGLLLCTMILVCALLFQRGINLMEYKSEKFEQITQGKLSILVRNGVMQMDELKQTNVSRQQLFSVLRNDGIQNLGEVDRVYLETCGLFSIYKKSQPVPGLVIFPPNDNEIDHYLQDTNSDNKACTNCGNVAHNTGAHGACAVCQADQWQPASIATHKHS
jgi:uncharacterized membrane protein YcaP (DUF421 family)